MDVRQWCNSIARLIWPRQCWCGWLSCVHPLPSPSLQGQLPSYSGIKWPIYIIYLWHNLRPYAIDIFLVTYEPQYDSLTGDASSVDVATTENLQSLVEIGKELLKKPVSRVNLDTGKFEEIEGEGTNEEVLANFAKLLVEERKFRLNQWKLLRNAPSISIIVGIV